MNKEIVTVLNTVVTLADEKKASNIRAYHFQENAWIADVVIVMSASNLVHAKALVETFKQTLTPTLTQYPEQFYETPHVIGDAESGWIILDLNSIIIHCLLEDLRDYYALDKIFEKRSVVYHH